MVATVENCIGEETEEHEEESGAGSEEEEEEEEELALAAKEWQRLQIRCSCHHSMLNVCISCSVAGQFTLFNN